MMIFQGKRVTVVGLGTQGGGVGTVRWLLRQGATVLVTDRASRVALQPSINRIMRSAPNASVTYHLGRTHAKEDIIGTDLVVINPDVPRSSPVFSWARSHHIPIRIGDTSLFIERCPASIIGVTGTRGKTTTSMAIGAMLKSVDKQSIVAGNLRVSPLDDLDRLKRSAGCPSFVVLELSSWQVEGLWDICMSPSIAVLTNVYPDHLNRYGSMREYAAAKMGIFQFQKSTDDAVLNYDNPWCRRIGKKLHSTVWWVSSHEFPKGLFGAFCRNHWIVLREPSGERNVLRRSSCPLLGEHNTMNILCAVVASRLAGASLKSIRAATRELRGVAGRLEYVRTHHGVRYINDTAATSPQAVIAALQAVGGSTRSIILIAGGTDKGLEYAAMAKEVKKVCRGVVLLHGSATDKIRRLLQSILNLSIQEQATMKQAVAAASALAAPGDTVLLSPGAASFGLFANAYDRGDQFRMCVRRL